MPLYTVTFQFLHEPQGDIQTYSDIDASSEDEAIAHATNLLKNEFPNDVCKEKAVTCRRQVQIILNATHF